MLAIRDGDQFPPKRLLLRSMNLKVVRLAIEVEDMIPLNRLYDITNNVRDVKLFKHGGRIPSKSLEERSNSSSFFNEHSSVKSKRISNVYAKYVSPQELARHVNLEDSYLDLKFHLDYWLLMI